MWGTRNATAAEKRDAKEDATEAVKAALLISGANKTKSGRLKVKLANNYLLGTDQYPDTYENAMCILGNYQTGSRPNMPYQGDGTESGLAFIQQGGRGLGRGGRGEGAGPGTPTSVKVDAGGGDTNSVVT